MMTRDPLAVDNANLIFHDQAVFSGRAITDVDFIGVGVQRAATTWLADVMACHPEIHLPVKETQYFNANYGKGPDWYAAQFAGRMPGQIVGEFTPDYLPSKLAIDRLVRDQPKAKLIVILRDPVDRAFSAYTLFKGRGRIESRSFSDAINQHRFLIEYGYYTQQLSYLYKLVPRERVFLRLYDDIQSRPRILVQELLEWLGVQRDFWTEEADRKSNVSVPSGIQRLHDSSHFLQAVRRTRAGRYFTDSFIRVLRSVRRCSITKEDQATMNSLAKLYHDDTRLLSGLIQRDLDGWQSMRRVTTEQSS